MKGKSITKKIAYFDTSHDMPEEIISAAGFIPYKILGDVRISNDPADEYLPKFFCPAARSWLTEALAKSNEWEGIIFAHGCDTSNRHYDIWKLHVRTPFLYWFNSPIKDNANAAGFYKAELKRMIKKIEEYFKVEITQEKIRDAIRESNKIKYYLRRISQLRLLKNIPNRSYLELLMKGLQMSKFEFLTEVELTLSDWQALGNFPENKKKVLLTGSDITYPEWMDILEECNIRVIRDDLSIGERYYATSIPEREDPLDSLIEYYQNIPKPATKLNMNRRIEYLLNSLEESPVDAVISQNLKFCEPYALDSVSVNNALREKGYKVLQLEREFSPISDQQVINRLTAFIETL